MPDLRIYRLAFAPALLAFVALMFSLQGTPEGLEPAVPPASFEDGRATATARAIVATGPERPPGSEADEAAADLVAERFSEVRPGTVTEQPVEAMFEGDEVEARNIVLSLPGESPATVVVLAGRDAAGEAASTQAAAATAALVELGSALGVSSHAKTFVLASTAAGPAGAVGAERLVEGLPDPSQVEAVVVLAQPSAEDPRPPFVIDSSTGAERTPAQLVATAQLAIEEQVGLMAEQPTTFRQLSRLAFPSGLGEQAPLVAAGFDAIAISSAGERPLESESEPGAVSRRLLGGFGRAASSIVQAIDVAERPLERGPDPYVSAGDNLVPGWALALLGLALLLPALVAAVDAIGWTLRRGHRIGAALGWAAGRMAAPVAALGALYALALVGLVPRPSFPFDPASHGLGLGAAVALVLIVAVGAAGALAATRLPHASAAERPALIAAIGAVAVAAALLIWLSNPYLGLLVAPLAHIWLVAAVGARALVGALAAAATAIPVVFGLGEVAAALELGIEAPWTFLVMVADGQIPFGVALPLCLLAGSVAGTLIACRRGPESIQ